MNKAHENINWVDYPLVDTPLASVNLNKMDRSIDTIDDRVIALDSTKADAVDVLTSVVDAVLDENTGVITLTRNNGTTITLQTNLNRLATNLRYDSDPTSEHYQQLILSYNTDPVTYGYVDLSALITQYEFTDSSIIHFAVTSGVISATIIDGSITAEKLQPNFLADCQTAKAQAESAETGAGASALVSEGWAKGTQNGIQVTSQSPYYHNNAEWFKDQAQSISGGSLAGLSDVELDMVSQGQTIYWDEASQKWVNGTASAGILPKLHIVTESTSSVTVTKGTETFTPTLIEAGVYEMDAPEYGTYTVKATNSLGTQTTDVVVDACKIYNVTVYHFTATITVTYPAGAVCTLTKDGTTITATADPETFSVNEVGTYTVAITQDGQTVSDTVTITTDGQTESITLDFAYIVLTIPSSLIGQTVTITDGTSTRTWLADSTTHSFVCILGNYTLSVGTYSTSVSVVAYTTYTAQFTPEGSTITPTDSVQILLNCADIWDKTSYTTIADLIADDTSLLTVLTSDNAIDYLVRSTTFASAITADSDAMAMIGAYDYASDTLLADATWATAILKSSYSKNVYNIYVPDMTSNTTPKGIASAQSVYGSGSEAYKAFDGNDTTSSEWAGSNGSQNNGWLQYEFTRPVNISALVIDLDSRKDSTSNYRSFTGTLQGSNDSAFTNLLENFLVEFQQGVSYSLHTIFSNANKYKTIRIQTVSYNCTYQNGYAVLNGVQFYGRENGGVQSWLRAGGITDKSYTTLAEVLADTTTLSALISNHDAVDYLVTAKGLIDGIVADATAMSYIGLNNYCANTLLGDEEWCKAIINSAYVDTVCNIKVPTMTSNTTPSGECGGNGYYHNYWYAFDGVTSDHWTSDKTGKTPNARIWYKFTSAKLIKAFKYMPRQDSIANSSPSNYTIDGSNDGTNWTTLYTGTGESAPGAGQYVLHSLSNATNYQYLSMYISTTTGGGERIGLAVMQFYGREDV